MAEQTGHAYRRADLSLAELSALLAAVFGAAPIYAFSADVGALGPIVGPQAAGEVRLADASGQELDFGHVFNDHAEVRWRRRASGYDALGLAEDADGAAQLESAGMREIGSFSAVAVPDRAAIILSAPARGAKKPRLRYVEYRGVGGAPQLARYCAVIPAEE